MLSLGLEKHLEELTQCSLQASKEYALENVRNKRQFLGFLSILNSREV